MPFWSRKKPIPQKEQGVNVLPSTVVIMQSECLGMTVIEEDNSNCSETKEISVEEWIQILETKKLNGYPFERIYFSFLKGIPTFMRMKIWILLCSENNAKKLKYTSKNDLQKKGNGSWLKAEELTLEVYLTLCTNAPLQAEFQQIEKDVHRSFSAAKSKYKYLSPLLRKLLYASSNSGIQYSQGMNYILLNIIIYCLQSLGLHEGNIDGLCAPFQRDIFLIYRETIMRMEEVFGHNNILKVMEELEEKIAEAVPDVLYRIYECGMDMFSSFSQNYFSVMSYGDTPEELCKQMLDLFFLTGEKAIHATTVKMLEVTRETILSLKGAEALQKFLKNDIYEQYYKVFLREKETAKTLSDFGLCFFDSVERLKM